MLMGRCLWKHSQSHRIFLVYIYTPPKKNFIVQKMKGEKEKSQARRSSLTPHQQERWAFLVVYSIPVSSCTKSGLQHTHLLCTTVINVCLQEKRKKGETREKNYQVWSYKRHFWLAIESSSHGDRLTRFGTQEIQMSRRERKEKEISYSYRKGTAIKIKLLFPPSFGLLNIHCEK